MDTNRFARLGDFVKAGANLLVSCRCGHSAPIDRLQLMRWFMVRRLREDLPGALRHLKCRRCGARPTSVSPTSRPQEHLWGPQSEAQWKAIIQRLRD